MKNIEESEIDVKNIYCTPGVWKPRNMRKEEDYRRS